MALGTPALLLTLFGYALTLDVDNVPLAVWDQSGTERSREFVSRFAGSRYFSLRTHVNNYADLVRAIDTRRGDDGPGGAPRFRPADRRRPRRARATAGRRQRLEHGHHRHRLCRRDRGNLRPRPDVGAEPAARGGQADDPLGRAAPGVVQRGIGVEKLHHPRPDRRDHDGHRGHAHLADGRPGMGAGHDGAVDFHAGEGRPS